MQRYILNRPTRVVEPVNSINIFDYLEYRSFLRDYYERRKLCDSKFSYRYFALQAGINSSGMYANVVQGRKKLTPRSMEQFAKGLDLNFREKEYFALMVDYTNQQNSQIKDEILQKMMSYKPVPFQRLYQKHREFYSHWSYVAVHQALEVINIRENYKDLAHFISPPLKVPDTKKVMRLLEELEMIALDENGFWRPTHKSIIGGVEVGVAPIHEFQKEMMGRAKESLALFDKEERHVVSNTIATTATGIKKIKASIRKMQMEIDEIVKMEKGNRVFQLNAQIFPLSNAGESKHV